MAQEETRTTSEVDGNEEDAEGDQGDQDVQCSCTGKFNAKLRLLSCPSCKLNIDKNAAKEVLNSTYRCPDLISGDRDHSQS